MSKSSYNVYDFTESLGRAGIALADIERVWAAWGHSPEDYGSWEGGFLLAMKDGRVAYVWGWCDTTGWGCQDGGGVEWVDGLKGGAIVAGEEPTPEGASVPPGLEWDSEPADLNEALKKPDPEAEVVR